MKKAITLVLSSVLVLGMINFSADASIQQEGKTSKFKNFLNNAKEKVKTSKIGKILGQTRMAQGARQDWQSMTNMVKTAGGNALINQNIQNVNMALLTLHNTLQNDISNQAINQTVRSNLSNTDQILIQVSQQLSTIAQGANVQQVLTNAITLMNQAQGPLMANAQLLSTNIQMLNVNAQRIQYCQSIVQNLQQTLSAAQNQQMQQQQMYQYNGQQNYQNNQMYPQQQQMYPQQVLQ